jgi:hypothetical protein
LGCLIEHSCPGKQIVGIGNPNIEGAVRTLHGLWNLQPEAAAPITMPVFVRAGMKVFCPASGQGAIISYEFDPQPSAWIVRQKSPSVKIAALQAVHAAKNMFTCCLNHTDCPFNEVI